MKIQKFFLAHNLYTNLTLFEKINWGKIGNALFSCSFVLTQKNQKVKTAEKLSKVLTRKAKRKELSRFLEYLKGSGLKQIFFSLRDAFLIRLFNDNFSNVLLTAKRLMLKWFNKNLAHNLNHNLTLFEKINWGKIGNALFSCSFVLTQKNQKVKTAEKSSKVFTRKAKRKELSRFLEYLKGSGLKQIFFSLRDAFLIRLFNDNFSNVLLTAKRLMLKCFNKNLALNPNPNLTVFEKSLTGKIVFSYLLLLTSYSFLFSQQTDLFSYDNRMKFGNYLYETKDYLRAVDEYRACLKINQNDTLQFKIGEAFFEMGQYNFAAEEFYKLFSSKEFGYISKISFLKTQFAAEKYDSLQIFQFPDEEQEVLNYQLKFVNLSLMITEENLSGYEKYFQPFSDREKSVLLDFYEEKKSLPYKSPLKAAVFSAIIPGAGKIYTGDYGDGITAFLATGLFAFLAYDNFKAEHNFRAWLFTGLGAFFYCGNVYGSAASAQIHNAKVKNEFEAGFKLFLKNENYFIPFIRF